MSATVIDEVVRELAPDQTTEQEVDQTTEQEVDQEAAKVADPKPVSGRDASIALRLLTGDAPAKLRGSLGASDTAVALGFKPLAKAGKHYDARVWGVSGAIALVKAAMADPRCSVSDGAGGSIRFDLAVRMKLGAAKDLKGMASKALGYVVK